MTELVAAVSRQDYREARAWAKAHPDDEPLAVYCPSDERTGRIRFVYYGRGEVPGDGIVTWGIDNVRKRRTAAKRDVSIWIWLRWED